MSGRIIYLLLLAIVAIAGSVLIIEFSPEDGLIKTLLKEQTEGGFIEYNVKENISELKKGDYYSYVIHSHDGETTVTYLEIESMSGSEVWLTDNSSMSKIEFITGVNWFPSDLKGGSEFPYYLYMGDILKDGIETLMIPDGKIRCIHYVCDSSENLLRDEGISIHIDCWKYKDAVIKWSITTTVESTKTTMTDLVELKSTSLITKKEDGGFFGFSI